MANKPFNKPNPAAPKKPSSLREKIHEIIFEAETPAGWIFDVLLLVAILASVVLVCLETVESFDKYGDLFFYLEWFFTIIFTVEYLLRLYCVRRPLRYALSFFGVVDLLAILPAYISMLLASSPSFAVVRAFRLLRIFRIFKLVWFMNEADELFSAMTRARAKIVVFVGVVAISVTVAGTLMYEIENWGSASRVASVDLDPDVLELKKAKLQQTAISALEGSDFELANTSIGEIQALEGGGEKSRFTSIPQSIYWAVVTMTTVGYGDIVPVTTVGKFVAAILILMGYSFIIVPTGFVSAEFVKSKADSGTTHSCPSCITEGHDVDAVFCKYCGEQM